MFTRFVVLQALKGRLAGKIRCRRQERWPSRDAAAGRGCYDNEAVDNAINEFVAGKRRMAAGRLDATP